MKTAIYKKFKDYNDFKDGAQFFKKGSIVPARVAKFGLKRDIFSSRLVFEHDTYMRIIDGVILLLPSEYQYKNGNKFALRADRCSNVEIFCAPYCKYLVIFGWDGNKSPIDEINKWIK